MPCMAAISYVTVDLFCSTGSMQCFYKMCTLCSRFLHATGHWYRLVIKLGVRGLSEGVQERIQMGYRGGPDTPSPLENHKLP